MRFALRAQRALQALRLLAGFALACCVAGLTQVAFIVTPSDLANLPAYERPARLGAAALLALLATGQTALFAAPLGALAIAEGLRRRLTGWRGRGYFIAAGGAIAALAVMALSAGPAGFPGAYASAAYLLSGILGGAVYGLIAVSGKSKSDAGRRA